MAGRLVVLIATAGRPQLLARTLDSLAACRRPDNYVDTVVVENGEKLGAEEVVRNSLPLLKARYIHVATRSKSAALNAALDVLQDCLIVFTDDDARFDADTLCAYADAASGVDRDVVFGGPVGVDYIQKPPAWLVDYLCVSARGWESTERQMARRNWSFLGINWAAFSEDLKRIGGFSEHIGPGSWSGATGQETQAQALLLRAGCAKKYVPAARVWHFVPEERCSPDWTIQRLHQHGISLAAGLWQEGMVDSPFARGLAFVRRVPTLAALLARPGAPYEFKRRYVRAYWNGFRQGLRLFRGRGNADPRRSPVHRIGGD